MILFMMIIAFQKQMHIFILNGFHLLNNVFI